MFRDIMNAGPYAIGALGVGALLISYGRTVVYTHFPRLRKQAHHRHKPA
jgi:hypothetical protein